MPHYIVQLDDEGDDVFAVYSTIVDNLLTETMDAKGMKAWLVDHEYGAWLTQDAEYGLEGFDADTRASIIRYRRDAAEYMYWHDEGFQHCKYTDQWFTLPRRHWRND